MAPWDLPLDVPLILFTHTPAHYTHCAMLLHMHANWFSRVVSLWHELISYTASHFSHTSALVAMHSSILTRCILTLTHAPHTVTGTWSWLEWRPPPLVRARALPPLVWLRRWELTSSSMCLLVWGNHHRDQPLGLKVGVHPSMFVRYVG